MAEDVGALVARVVADTEGFRSEMTRMARLVESNTARMNSNLSRIGKTSDALAGSFRLVTRVAAAFGVALSVRALGQFTMGAINAAAELHNLSTRLNISVEAMSELQHVARVTDVEFGTFSKSLQIMARNFGEASKGSKSMQDTFRQLGLDFNLLSTSAIDVQLEAVAEALIRVTDEGQRAALAQEVLGRGGVEMLQSFEGGAAGIRKLRQELRDLGAVTSTETAKAADEAKDAMDRMKASTTALSNELVNALAPALTLTSDKLREWFFPTEQEALITGTTGAIRELREEIEDLERTLTGLESNTRRKAQLEATGALAEMESRLASLKNSLSQMEAGLARIANPASPAAAPVPGLVNPQPAGGTRLNDWLREQGLLTTGMQRIGGAEGLGGKPAEEANEAFRKNEEETTAIVEEHWQRRLQAATDATAGMMEVVQHHAEQEIMWRETVASSAIGLLSALGAKHRGAAIAALTIQKALAVKEILIQSQVASMRALAELGPIAGAPVAASILAKGKISAALVAATGLVEAAQLSSGGTQSTLGTTANPIATRSVSSAGPNILPHKRDVTEIHLHGDIYGWDDYVERRIIDGFRRAVNDRDVVIINADSRQGELLGATV